MLIYKSSWFYEFCVRCLYGPAYEDRYRPVADEIPSHAEVLDICCGDFQIYKKYLKQRQIRYTGLDKSKAFARCAGKSGIPFIQGDVTREKIPRSDYILLMGSLYQFYDESGPLLRTLLKAANQKLIVTEDLKSLGRRENLFVSGCAQLMTGAKKRFSPESFDILMREFTPFIEKKTAIADGHEIMVIFNVQKYNATTPATMPCLEDEMERHELA